MSATQEQMYRLIDRILGRLDDLFDRCRPRSAVVVDQEFDVTVDGQRLDTLSGSGKAVANLALRLGLGQVLTNNVLSLFVGDEIDASMDDTRAENLGSCIHQLAGKISQIIQITHKSGAEADWSISLG
jgi:exonuclease SbcC